MASRLNVAVTGGAPNILGSFTAAARSLPGDADWTAFGVSHTPENCGHPWAWQKCSQVSTIPASPCVDEEQVLTITGAGGGDFTLTANPTGGGPFTTSPIPYGTAPGGVQAALEALPNVGPGDIVVTGGPDVYTFDYSGGQYACTNVAPLVADCTGLTAPVFDPAPVDLLTAETYGVLAGSTVTNVPTSPTLITGDLGLDPGSAVTGFPLGVVTGATEVNSAAAIQAKADLVTAYLDAAGRPTDFLLDPDIGGQTLPPGVYTTDGTPASLGITGNVNLDAGGDPDAVWIFQIESTLITAPGASVTLLNGAQACNVFWQVGSSATLDTTTEFVGTILALTSITANTGANVDGRLLARDGAVTLDDNNVTVPECEPAELIGCIVTTTVQGSPATEESVSEKPLNEGVGDVTFEPFLIEYNAASCVGGIPGDWDQLADRARRGLAVRSSKGIAEVFSSSVIQGDPNDSPNLPSVAVDITPLGGPSSLVNTIAGLLEEAEACGLNGEIYIHAPGWTLPHFLQNDLIERVGNSWKMGPHTVILDQGYSNEGPTGEGSDPDVPQSPAAVSGQAYIYVTGPFEYATGPIEVFEDTTRGVDTRLNKANVIAGQLAIYRFDPCCVYAALAQVC